MTMQRFILPTLLVSLVLPIVFILSRTSPLAVQELPSQTRGSPTLNLIRQTEVMTENTELVGQLGGPVYAVAIRDTYAYIGVGSGLFILDISNPAQPVVTGQAPILPGLVTGVAVAGDYAYVAESAWDHDPLQSGGGLHIIHIANPTAPVKAGFYPTPGDVANVAVLGNYAYLAESSVWNEDSGSFEGGGLHIIDITNPTAPVEASFYTPLPASDVVVVGNLAYVAAGENGLQIINITNPTTPILAGLYNPAGFAIQQVAVVGNRAYVGGKFTVPGNYHGRLRIINIANPANPIARGFYDWPETVIQDVAVAGSYAYVATYFKGGEGGGNLDIVDISRPAAPTQVSYYNAPGQARGVVTAGNRAYVADGNRGLRLIDITAPAEPSEIGFYNSPKGAYNVTVAGNYAYVIESSVWDDELMYVGAGLRLVDITNPAKPTSVSFYDVPGEALDVAVADNYAYTAEIPPLNQEVGRGLRILNIANPATPAEVSFYDTPGDVQGVVVTGNYAYLAEYPTWDNSQNTDVGGGLRIINIADPANPSHVGFYDSPGHPLDVAVAGNYAYLADSEAGLRIINITDPASPSEVGFYSSISASGVAVANHYAYVIGNNESLHILDVTDPANPVEAGSYNTPFDRFGSIVVTGHYAYIAGHQTGDNGGFSGLSVLDIANPAEPIQVGFYFHPLVSLESGLAVAGNTAYMAGNEQGLVILRIPNGSVLTYTIAGQITDSQSNPVPEVILSITGGQTTTTDSTGQYLFSDLLAGTYTITPTKPGYSFAPISQTVTLPPEATAQDFVATATTGLTYTITGRVTDGQGQPIAGVTLIDNAGHITTTDSTGHYTFTGLAPGTYIITPAKENYRFTPVSRTASVPPEATGQDFKGTLTTEQPIFIFLPFILR